MPLTVDENQFDEFNDTLKDIAYGLSEIGRGVGNPEYCDGPESLTEAVDRVASSMGRLAESVTHGCELLAKAIRSIRP